MKHVLPRLYKPVPKNRGIWMCRFRGSKNTMVLSGSTPWSSFSGAAPRARSADDDEEDEEEGREDRDEGEETTIAVDDDDDDEEEEAWRGEGCTFTGAR